MGIRVLHLTSHLQMGGITRYVYMLARAYKGCVEYSAVVSQGGDYARFFNAAGIDTFEVNLRTKTILHPKLFLAIRPIVKIIRQKNITVIHAHTRISQVVAQYVSWVTGVPFVTTCHGFYRNNIGRMLVPAWGSRVIAISNEVGDDLRQQFHVNEERIRTVYNGIDCDALEQEARRMDVAEEKKRFGLSDAFPVVGIVARMVQDKGYHCLIDACALLKERYPRLRLLLVGDGKYRPQIEQQVNEKGLRNMVVYAGVQTSVVKALIAMDIFVLPTLTREGFGLAVVEAMALKKNVIVSDCGGLKTVVRHGVDGFRFASGDSDALARMIEQLIADPDVAARMRNCGYQSARERFSVRGMAQGICDVYRDVLGK